MNRPSSTLLAVTLVTTITACGDNAKQPISPDAGMQPDGSVPLAPIERAHAGGAPTAVAVSGGRAYIAVGPRLTIWNTTSNPPTFIGETAALRGVIQAIAIAGTRAYVAERVDLDSQIHVFDITTPSAPTETHSFSVADAGAFSFTTAMQANDTHLFVADQEQGIVELSLANPDAPIEVRTGGSFGVTKLILSGSRLYYTSQGFIGGASLGVVDISNELADLGSAPIGNVNGVGVAGNLAIGAGPDGIYVYDVSDPTNPVEKFHVGEAEMGPFSRGVVALGTTAWVPAVDGLYILDLSNPDAIVKTGPLASDSIGVNAVSASAEQVAYVTDRGRLVVLDAATASQPELARAADVTLCANCVGVSTENNTLFVADIVGGVRSAELGNLSPLGKTPALPVQTIGGLSFVFEDVAVADARAFVADWMYGMRVYDVSNPASPTLLGSLQTGGAPGGISIVGDRAYVAEGTDGGFLRIVDITNPAAPTLLGSHGTSKAMDVEVRDAYAYVADESLFGPGGLRILNIAAPSAITEVALYNEDCQSARKVALAGNIAVVACGGDDFHFVDIADPAAPKRIAVVHPEIESSSAWSVATYEGHAVLGHDNGVIVTTLGASPQVVATFATSSSVRALTVPAPGRIVASAGQGGVYQFEVD